MSANLLNPPIDFRQQSFHEASLMPLPEHDLFSMDQIPSITQFIAQHSAQEWESWRPEIYSVICRRKAASPVGDQYHESGTRFFWDYETIQGPYWKMGYQRQEFQRAGDEGGSAKTATAKVGREERERFPYLWAWGGIRKDSEVHEEKWYLRNLTLIAYESGCRFVLNGPVAHEPNSHYSLTQRKQLLRQSSAAILLL